MMNPVLGGTGLVMRYTFGDITRERYITLNMDLHK